MASIDYGTIGASNSGLSPLSVSPTADTNSENASGLLGAIEGLGSDALKAFSVSQLSSSGAVLPTGYVQTTQTNTPAGTTSTTLQPASSLTSGSLSWILIVGLLAVGVGLFLYFK